MAGTSKREQTNKKIAAAVTKLDDATVNKLEEAFAMGCPVTEACLFAGISRTTYYEWVKNNKDLADRFETLRERPVLKARTTIVKDLDKNVETAKWFAERKLKDEFSRREERTGADGKPIVDLTQMMKEIIKRT